MQTHSGVSDNASMPDRATTEIPGFVAGTWDIDPITSGVSFLLRHNIVGKVLGAFKGLTGIILTGQDYSSSSVSAEVDAATASTGGATSDRHVRSARFLDVEDFPTITFRSSAVRFDGTGFHVHGDLTIRGTARPVVLDVASTDFTPAVDGVTRAHFTATTEISRGHFHVRPKGALGLMDNPLILGDTVRITLAIESVRRGDNTDAPVPVGR